MTIRTINARKCVKSVRTLGVAWVLRTLSHYLGIVMWMGIIKLPEMRMYWARNMNFSLSAFPQTMPRRSFEAIQKYCHSFNRRAMPKDNPDKLMIIRPVLDFIIG